MSVQLDKLTDHRVAIVNGEAFLNVSDSLPPAMDDGDPLRRLLVAVDAAMRSTPYAMGARVSLVGESGIVVGIPIGADLHAIWTGATAAARSAVMEWERSH